MKNCGEREGQHYPYSGHSLVANFSWFFWSLHPAVSRCILQRPRAWVDSSGIVGHLSLPAWEEHLQHLKPTTTTPWPPSPPRCVEEWEGIEESAGCWQVKGWSYPTLVAQTNPHTPPKGPLGLLGLGRTLIPALSGMNLTLVRAEAGEEWCGKRWWYLPHRCSPACLPVPLPVPPALSLLSKAA